MFSQKIKPIVAIDEAFFSDWEYLRNQIYTRAIGFSEKLFFDFRQMLTNAKIAEVAGRLMWQLIKRFEPTVIIGPGFGATPLLYATALAALQDGVDLNVLMIRDQRKAHNRKRWVEGQRQPDGARAVMIDDFMQRGSALSVVEKALAADKHQLDIVAIALFFDMWQPLGSRQISLQKCPVLALFKRHHIGLSRDCFDAVPPLMKGAHPPFLSERLWWRFGLNHTAQHPHKSTPVIDDGAVFVADDTSRAWRHNATTGDIDWQYQSLARPKKGIVQRLQYADNSLVFGCYDGTLTRLNAQDGSLIWRWRLDSNIHATPHLDLANQRLFINTEQWNDGHPYGHLKACDWRTGHTLWQVKHAYWPPASPVYSPEQDVCDSGGGVVVAACNDLSVIAVNAADGSVRWRSKTHGLVRGKPAIHGQYVYCATETGRLHCLNLADGAPRWCIRYGVGARHSFVQIANGCVVIFDGEWHMSGFDCETGVLRWIVRLRERGAWCPVIYGHYLVALSTAGQVAVFDTRTQLKVWETASDGPRGEFQQAPAIGRGPAGQGSVGQDLFAAASNNAGLQVFNIHPFYSEQSL